MPRGDGTGPLGLGPMTGRVAGYCAGYPVPGFMNPYGGRGLGMAWDRGGGRGLSMAWRRGWGRGFCHLPFPPAYVPWAFPVPVPFASPTREQEKEALRGQAEWLRQQLEAITRRLEELEQEKA